MEESTISLTWHAARTGQAIAELYAKLPARSSRLIGSVHALDRSTGYFLGKEVYSGDDSRDAKRHVEAAFNVLPEHVRRALATPTE